MDKKLSKDAYGGVNGKDYVPYVSDGSKSGGNISSFESTLIFFPLYTSSILLV